MSLFSNKVNKAAAPTKASKAVPVYQEEDQKIEGFLKTYLESGDRDPFYLRQLREVADGERKVVDVFLDHLMGFAEDDALLQNVIRNGWSYLKCFERVCDRIVEEMNADNGGENALAEDVDLDAHAVLTQHRKLQLKRQQEEAGFENNEFQDEEEALPPALLRRFELKMHPLTKEKPQSLREVKSSQIGRIVTIRGIVTRVAEVLPRIVVACYMCQNCGYECYESVNARDFTPKTDCPIKKCSVNKKRSSGSLYLRAKYSRFVKYQEIRIQELPDQVPTGNVPRSIVVEARGESTRQCTAGDIVQVTGIFLPEKPRVNSFRASTSGGGLVFSTYLRCLNVVREKRTEGAMLFDPEQFDEIVEAEKRAGRSMYDRLARSIAPEIYGHDDVKKAILLQLIGGVAKNMPDGMKIRGDINIALFGDPGVAKSQLLKHVTTIAPRAVYTTGKGSSGVGLTAAVTRDSFTGEVALEGGALVLADKGICCIDEFDKMDDSDRTAIHEVMEQQTVSIAKAGITTTLNARTAVLAAANPLYGRYNKKLSPTQNINLPAALLSRFDLLFLLLDKVGAERDRSLAEHVTYVHMHRKHPALEVETMPVSFVRAFIERSRQFNPALPDFESEDPELRERGRRVLSHIVEAYVEMRQQDASDTENDHVKSALTPRQLLSILRIASAHARVRFASELAEEDVDEAIRLVRASKSSLEENETVETERDDPISRIFRVLSEMIKARADESDPNPSLRYAELEERVLRMGFTRDQLKRTLDEYSRDDVGVIHVDSSGTQISFFEAA